ncbi:ribosome assembly factor SBDS [Candidatus Pacearchaeota archaeon CG10_big_fil_rev_8_21_14_0_10_31_9]|nr:MAG: rRNA metabolism protein [Candidatus Pacearchaeota archaeon CG1_02_32_21]PIN91759.1 MAG: ribosome assembly factor SBDS [Candidatus Pacearchaeota archaeon CG10_big_fil_rev_8_21_14_0_10_31_9]PIZ83773.1 MAG: ribosome assembly factor SBDS [Candidatus Pacearchaeota archaeon CG_4_10_14_0_2_um_filter_05_32_18]
MTDVIARIKTGGKHFEILVDVDKALAFKKGGNISINEVLVIDKIFTDAKKGDHASGKDLEEVFKTQDSAEVARQIIKRGDIEVPVEYKHKELSDKAKQIVTFLSKNAVDPRTGRPYTPERIESAIKESGVNITNKPIDSQLKEITEKIAIILPLRIETKRIKIIIPARYSGQAYGVVRTYKEREEWMNNGDLEIIINLPVGLQMEFYDKLNSLTHGSVISQEVKE